MYRFIKYRFFLRHLELVSGNPSKPLQCRTLRSLAITTIMIPVFVQMLGIHSTPVCCLRHFQGERCYLRAEFSRTGYSELGVLVRVVVEEALGVYQAEEHLWQVVLKCDGSRLSCCAVRGGSFFCLPHRPFTRVDEATLP